MWSQVPVQTVLAKGDDGGRAVAAHEGDQLGVKFGDVRPLQIAVRMIADEDFGHGALPPPRGSQGARVAERVVVPRVDWSTALAVRRRHDDDAQPAVGEPRQRAAARERLIVGMSEDGEDRTAWNGSLDHECAAAIGRTPAILR